MKNIEYIVSPETNETKPFPPILPKEFNSISEPLNYSIVPDYLGSITKAIE